MFYTKLIRPEPVYEDIDPYSKVETAGYSSAERQITDMIRAGIRLGEYRREMYDFEDGEKIDDEYFDPTRRRNYDMADASNDLRVVSRRLSDKADKAKNVEDGKKKEVIEGEKEKEAE